MAKLIINPSSGAKKEIPVAGKIVSIGRDPSNDLVLSDAMVSRRHAILERRGEQYVLRDNSSSNGTTVNGERVSSERSLRDGDLIAIGSARLLFNAEESISTPSLPSPGSLATQPMPIRPVPPAPSTSTPANAAARSGLSCLSCAAEASPFDHFCRQCGDKLPDSSVKQVACKSCHAVVMLPAKFCGSCGKPLLSEARRPTKGPDSGLRAESAEPSAKSGAPPSLPPSNAPRARMEAGMGASGAGTPVRPGSAVTSARSKSSASAAAQAQPANPAGIVQGVVPEPSHSRMPRVEPSPSASDRAAARYRTSVEEPGGFWIRLAAYSIDAAIVSLPVLLASGAWAFWLLEQQGTVAPAEVTPRLFLLPILGAAASLLLSLVYPVYFWALRGATPGKQIFGLRVLSMDGETPIGWQRAMLRVIGYIINGFVMGIGFLLIAVSEDKRGLHDRLADTRVLRRD